MKRIVLPLLLSVCVAASNAFCQDRPSLLPGLEAPKAALKEEGLLMDLDFKEVPVADVLGVIAREGKLKVMIGPEVKGILKRFERKGVTAEEALRQIAEEAGLDVKEENGAFSFVPAPQQADRPNFKPDDDFRSGDNMLREAVKPYILRVRFGDRPNAPTQEAEIAARDAFSLIIRVGENSYSLRGTASPQAGGKPGVLLLRMKLARRVANDIAKSSQFSDSVATAADGSERQLGGLTTRIQKGEHVVEEKSTFAPTISLHLNAEFLAK